MLLKPLTPVLDIYDLLIFLSKKLKILVLFWFTIGTRKSLFLFELNEYELNIFFYNIETFLF